MCSHSRNWNKPKQKVRFLVAPLLKDFNFGKSLKIKHFRDFIFLLIRIFLAELRTSVVLNRGQF